MVVLVDVCFVGGVFCFVFLGDVLLHFKKLSCAVNVCAFFVARASVWCEV